MGKKRFNFNEIPDGWKVGGHVEDMEMAEACRTLAKQLMDGVFKEHMLELTTLTLTRLREECGINIFDKHERQPVAYAFWSGYREALAFLLASMITGSIDIRAMYKEIHGGDEADDSA